jgi:hypothetical protein
MSRRGWHSALFFFLLFSVLGTAQLGGQVPGQGDQYVIKWLGTNARVEAMCGDFFGYDSIPGIDDKRISFKYATADGEKMFLRAVAYSNIRTEIDDSKEEPTVEFTAQHEIIVRISKSHFDQESECLPPPEE